MKLLDITLRPVAVDEEPRFKALLDAHHYLGAVAKIGHTLWYVATWQGQWLALPVVFKEDVAKIRLRLGCC